MLRCSMRAWSGPFLLALSGCVVFGCSSSDSEPAAPSQAIVDLRADNNRNGSVDLTDPTEDAQEDTWDSTHGAVFLANIDDDLHACPIKDPTTNKKLSDAALAACNDAADEVINGEQDLLDLARLQTVPWPQAPDDASGSIEVSEAAKAGVRLFIKGADGQFSVFAPGTALTPAQLRQGVELGLEGKDVLRDPTGWDGYVDITLRVKGGTSSGGQSIADGSDTVRLRMAPIMTAHHLQPEDTVYYTKIPGDPDSTSFGTTLQTAVQASGVPHGLEPLSISPTPDQWTQDYFEVGSMTMPAANHGQHVVWVYMRSANVDNPNSTTAPLRSAGRIVFEHFRGPDVAAIQQFDPKHSEEMDSLNSFGNTETVPPYENAGVSYPLGRVIRGSTDSFYPDPIFQKLLDAQRVQPIIKIDTSWLLVGHVDETISFVKASTPRGWALVLNDVALARKMLTDARDQGHGDVKMFAGQKWVDDNWNEVPAEVTISQVLDDTEVMSESANAVAEIDAQLQVLKQETGITDAEIIHVPFLHQKAYGAAVAYQPGTVNSVYLSDHDWAAADPHGPVIDGKDIFKQQLEQAFAPFGITVHYVEDWNDYHRLDGEVHCGSNSKRALPENVRWWETGR